MEAGALGVISELERPADFHGAWLQVSNVRRAMALAAAEVHHHPSRELQLVGVTGTNGKDDYSVSDRFNSRSSRRTSRDDWHR